MPYIQTRKWRCQYRVPCEPNSMDGHCFEAVPIDEPDRPGYCNGIDECCDPDWRQDLEETE